MKRHVVASAFAGAAFIGLVRSASAQSQADAGAPTAANPQPLPSAAPQEPAPANPVPEVPVTRAPEAPAVAAVQPPTPSERPPTYDQLPNAGYIPGYRRDKQLGVAPFAPAVGALPGGVTPGYGAPIPPNEWTFRWSGALSASLQFSSNERPNPLDGQSKTVFHTPPRTVDEYASFVGTNTVPGQWAQMSFFYGNPYASVNLSLSTWNPTSPTTYYQIGSEQFINNAYVAFNVPPLLGITLRANFGYFYNFYGNLAQYGIGMYTNSIVGGVRGVGEDLVAEYDLNDTLTVSVEDGFMGTRNGSGPTNVTPSGQNGVGNFNWPASWVHHLHVGLQGKGNPALRLRLSYIVNWAQDDHTQRPVDDPTTRQIDESYVKDGRIDIYGAEATFNFPVYGFFGAAVSYVHGRNAYPVRGTISFGGDGETLTNRWWGQETNGTGKLLVAGLNYTASLGRILSNPAPFTPGPDLIINAGFVIATTWTDFKEFDGRVRHKYGLDLEYSFLPFMGIGVRGDHVVPTSKDSGETFNVLAPRIVFRGGWDSRYTISLRYAKWFYGPRTHQDASLVMPGPQLDDQLFALNAQMYW